MFERQQRMMATGIILLLVTTLVTAAHAAGATASADTTVHEADEVVVTASRYDSDVHLSHTNLTRADIQRLQTATDVPLLLQDVPGAYVYSDASSGMGYSYLKIRGFDQRRIAVLVNGIPLNDPEDHQVWWVDLPDLASSLQDVQVQRGVTNGVSGITAIGGSVNLVTEVLGLEPVGRATVEVGSWGTARRMLRYQTGELGQGFSTGLRLSQMESDGYRDRSGSEHWAVFWSGRWQNDTHVVSANIYTGDELSHHAWWAVPESELRENRRANPETYWNAVDSFRQPHYELHWEWDLSDDLTLHNRAYTIHGDGFYENFKGGADAPSYSLNTLFPDRYAVDDEVDLIRTKWVRKDQTGWVPSLTWEHPGGRTVVGGDVYTFHSNHWGDVLSAGDGSLGSGITPDDVPDGLKYHDYAGDKTAWSIYANERWELVAGLTLLADVQFQHREYDFMQEEVGNFTGTDRHAYRVEYDFFNPKGGLHWDLPARIFGGTMGFYGHVGVTHREPSDSDYWGVWAGPDDFGVSPLFNTGEVVFDAAGNPQYVSWSGPQIEEEKVVNYEIGAAFQNRTLSCTVNGYWMDFENEIVGTGYWTRDHGTLRTNADKTVHKGIELGIRWRPRPDHGLTVGASRSWNEYDAFLFHDENDEYLDYSGHPIALFPEVLLSATWSSRVGPVAGDLRLRHVGKQYLDNTGNEDRTIDPNTVLDLALFVDVDQLGVSSLPGLEAFARVTNLFDEEYETWGYYYGGGENAYIPGMPRSYMVGMNYNF